MSIEKSDKNKQKFLDALRTKTKELGSAISIELLENINHTTTLLQASIGNELVIATFIPMIPQLIFDKIKKRIFDKEIADLGNRLHKVKDELNYEFINSIEGRRLFQKTVEEIITNAEDEKIEYFKQFITTSFTLEKPQELKLKKFREILLQMTTFDVKLLQLFCKSQKFIHELRPIKDKLNDEGKATYQLLLPIDLNDYYFKLDEGLFSASYNSLINWGLIQHKNKKLDKKDEVEPDNTAVYTLDNYWGFGQADFYVAKDRRHARKFLKEKQSENLTEDEIIKICLSALTMAFVTNFGWDFMCMVDPSIKPVSIDENVELKE